MTSKIHDQQIYGEKPSRSEDTAAASASVGYDIPLQPESGYEKKRLRQLLLLEAIALEPV